MSEQGHNSDVARRQLKAFVERIQRLEEENKSINDDKRDVYAEAKANGFDVKVLKNVISDLRQDQSERQERRAIYDLYMVALGQLPPEEVAEAAKEAVGTNVATRARAHEEPSPEQEAKKPDTEPRSQEQEAVSPESDTPAASTQEGGKVEDALTPPPRSRLPPVLPPGMPDLPSFLKRQ